VTLTLTLNRLITLLPLSQDWTCRHIRFEMCRMATRVATLQLESLGERGASLRNALLKIQRQTKWKFVVILLKSIHSLTLNKNHSKLHSSWIEWQSKLESYFPSNIRHKVRHSAFPCQFRNWPESTSPRKRQTACITTVRCRNTEPGRNEIIRRSLLFTVIWNISELTMVSESVRTNEPAGNHCNSGCVTVVS
jgi:hypothetical protein